MGAVRHLYVHLPFCAYRCGYCDFVTVVGRQGHHVRYVDALLAELELERALLAAQLETIFLGGGTPTYTDQGPLRRLLHALPSADEVTVEANPETVTPSLAALLREAGVTRVSLGVQSFRPHLLAVLERRARPDDVRRAFYHLRDANFDNISLDLIYGIPGQSASDLETDIGEALALAPEHLSCYELEAKAGTRFTHRHGDELRRQADALEGYFETIVDRLTSSGYRWYETANFCRAPEADGGRDLRSRHNLAYWLGRDYLALGIGAVSTVADRRWRNGPRLRPYVEALEDGRRPAREVEELDVGTRRRERLMLGLRLDEPLALEQLDAVVDRASLARMEGLGLLVRPAGNGGGHMLALTKRGRLLGGGVTAELLKLK
jgi:putative oxygen-independent coproporphyrinogen III oxidase